MRNGYLVSDLYRSFTVQITERMNGNIIPERYFIDIFENYILPDANIVATLLGQMSDQ